MSSRNPQKKAQVHRFGDLAAIHTNDMPNTVYMSASFARRLAAELEKVANSIDTETFSESTYGTVHIHENDNNRKATS